MDNKRFKVYITIFVITTIIASCFAVYFAIKLSNKNTENIIVDKVENVATDDVDKKETKVEIKEVEKQTMVDISEGLEENYYYIKSIPSLNKGIKVKIQNGKAYVAILDDTIGTTTYTKEKGKFYEIQNVEGKVVDVGYTRILTSGYPIFVLLMSDGTLQKTKFVSGSDIVCDGVIEGYNNIVRIENVECENKNIIGNEVVYMYSEAVVAVKEDGTTISVNSLFE